MSNTSFIPFIHWSFGQEIIRDRINIILDILHFIQEGTRLAGGRQAFEKFEVMENAIKASLFSKINTPLAKPIAKNQVTPSGDTLEKFVEVFSDEHKWVLGNAPIAAFRCGVITEPLQQRLNSFWHPEINEETANVATAFEVAHSNFARFGARLVLMKTLLRLLEISNTPDSWHEIYQLLMSRTVAFQRDLLMFGILEGGESSKTAIRIVASQVCYSSDEHFKYNVITFISRDGYSPGHWMTATEDSLYADIKAKYEAI